MKQLFFVPWPYATWLGTASPCLASALASLVLPQQCCLDFASASALLPVPCLIITDEGIVELVTLNVFVGTNFLWLSSVSGVFC
jgi:hypothetical protein